MDINMQDYKNPKQNFLTAIFGNAHRIDSQPLIKNNGSLRTQLVAQERRDGTWDIFSILQEDEKDEHGYAFISKNETTPLQSQVSKEIALNLIQDHNAQVTDAAIRRLNSEQLHRVL